MEISVYKPYKQFDESSRLIYSEAVLLNGWLVEVHLKNGDRIMGRFQTLTGGSSFVGRHVIQNWDVISIYLLSKPKV